MSEAYRDLDEALADERVTPFFDLREGRAQQAGVKASQRIAATPFLARDPTIIPPRQWLYGKHYVRSHTSTTIAPGGAGKTSLSCGEAVSMVTGRPLLGGDLPRRKLRVWLWNLEDPKEEMERRLAAVLLHFEIKGAELEGLFVDSGRSSPLILATKVRDQVVVAEPVVDDLIREIRDKRIDAIIVDPFVSSHAVPENDNGAIDRVVKTWAHIAEATSCAVELVHHARKPPSGSSAPFTVDDARGAVSLIGAVRSARILNVMSDDEAAKAGVPAEQRRSYFRIDDGKANMRPPLEAATWHRIVSVPLDNQTVDDDGDWVGVVTPWAMPGVMEGLSGDQVRKVQDRIAAGEWAENEQAGNWAGHAVAEALELDLYGDGVRPRIKTLLRTWIKGGALKIERRRDMKKGRDKPFVVVGAWL